MIPATDGASGPVRVAVAALVRPARLHARCVDHPDGGRECVAVLERDGRVFRCYLYRRDPHGRISGGRVACKPGGAA